MAGGLILSPHFVDRHGDELRRVCADAGLDFELLVLPTDPTERLDPATLERAEAAYFSSDVHPDRSRQLFAAIHGSPNLRWLQIFFAGTDNPVFDRILQRGVRITTASGSTAVPIAQTLITGLLMLSRGMLTWQESQRRGEWAPHPDDALPHDLAGEVLTVFGIGAIGKEVARLGIALGMHVIGVRRSPAEPGDPVHEMVPPSAIDDVLPQTRWLAITAPLSPQTRRFFDGERLARLPRGAHVLNVGRGEIVDEAALIAALQSGALGGAYLDVFEEEPLPSTSPLWAMPNVIITPHNSSAARGNARRAIDIFFENLGHYGRGEPLRNEVRPG